MTRFGRWVVCFLCCTANAQDIHEQAQDRTVLYLTNKRTGDIDIFIKGEAISYSTKGSPGTIKDGVIDSVGMNFLMISTNRFPFGGLHHISHKKVRRRERSRLALDRSSVKASMPMEAAVTVVVRGAHLAKSRKVRRVFYTSEWSLEARTYSFRD